MTQSFSVQFSSVQSVSRVWLFGTPWTTAHWASLSITNSWGLPKLMFIESVMPSNHLILCCPLLLLPSIFPSIRVFWVSSLHQYWSFSFNISPSNEHPGLISFRMDCKSVFVLQIISSLHLKYSLSALIYPSMFLKYATGQKVTFRGLDLFRYSLSITSIASLKPQTIKWYPAGKW